LETILEAAELLRERAISPVELTWQCLTNAQRLNPILNAFITLTPELALQHAKQAEAEIRQGGWRGPLHGIPLGLKDLIDTAAIRTTAASALFRERVPGEDAEVVRRLKNAGAVLLGKQNLHEFAYGGSSMISYFGEVHNPWNTDYIAGGSSGGSAAAVAAGLGYAAIGTDTAGSVRQPAAICGLVGLKPTYGRISCHGVIPLSVSLDHVGPLTRSVADAALLLQLLAGHDPADPNSAAHPVDDYLGMMRGSVASLRIGVPREFFYERLDPEIASACTHALTLLATMTGEIREVRLPVSTDRTLQSAESYAYHADNVTRHPDLYQPETVRRILTGARVTDAEYRKSRGEIEEMRRTIPTVFEEVDVLVTPTIPILPPTVGELNQHPDQLRTREIALLRNTRPVNVWALPAISVPCGFTDGGLPIGLQIVGRPWGEETVLRLAYAYEQATTWHKRRPAASSISGIGKPGTHPVP